MVASRESGVVRLRKSRHGCLACKQRKVKCDELKPVCGNCAKRYYPDGIEPCEYPSVPAPQHRPNRPNRSPPRPTATGSQPTSMIPRPTGVSSDNTRRLLEMRLMHHYTRVVALELPAAYGYSSRELWLDMVPQMAFESDLLLDSLLAISALHMQDLMPQDHELGIAANHYLDRTLVKHRNSLSSINKLPPGPLFITAFMLCITSWQNAHRRSSMSETYCIPLNVFALVRGCCILHYQHDELLSRAGFNTGDLWLPVSSDVVIQTHHPLLFDVEQDIAKLLEAFHVATMPVDEASAYRNTANCIISLHMTLVQKVDNTILQRLVFTMAVQMQPLYLMMLETRQPLALALYARILAVLGFIDHLWWSRGTNNRDFLQFSIHGIREFLPEKYAWVMEWPLRVLARDIALSS